MKDLSVSLDQLLDFRKRYIEMDLEVEPELYALIHLINGIDRCNKNEDNAKFEIEELQIRIESQQEIIDLEKSRRLSLLKAADTEIKKLATENIPVSFNKKGE